MEKVIIVKMTIKGYLKISNEETNNVEAIQFQSSTKDSKTGALKRDTIKLNKILTDEELKTLVGKTLEFTDVSEYKNGFDKAYGAKEFKIIDSKENIFDVDKRAVISLDNIFIKEDKNKNKTIVLQTEVFVDVAYKLYNISLKLEKFDEKLYKSLEKNIGNTLQVLDFVESSFNNKTYYSTKKAPILKSKS